MKQVKVMVLMGGETPEHPVSLVSGREVVRHLDKRKYQVFPVIIPVDGGKWQLRSVKQILKLSPAGVGKALVIKESPKNKALLKPQPLLFLPESSQPEVVFLALHGADGEDGTIQGILELAKIPYTGSGVLASTLGMDKIMFRKVMKKEKILTPRCLVFKENDSKVKIIKKFKFPFIVKPPNQGSSIGISLVNSRKSLGKALNLGFSYGQKVLIEEYLKGTEVTVGVLGNQNPKALPVVEIIPKTKFFNYDAKYKVSLCEEIVPARISKELTDRVQNLAVRVFESIGCRGFGRVDMITYKGRVYVLEINTIPGLTPNSLFPKQAAAAGISYPQLLDRLIELALEK